eukprot:TRINITY_DN30909_c0_g1_i1.p1 TRINITY_DN30909_c0_g1~~TRINITY_DN30909_c0_g1_i1.p1  ORF type:complete len:702 (+),score=16.90 TRINITY_DN30909_c0_g1_i1:102-2207(+)
MNDTGHDLTVCPLGSPQDSLPYGHDEEDKGSTLTHSDTRGPRVRRANSTLRQLRKKTQRERLPSCDQEEVAESTEPENFSAALQPLHCGSDPPEVPEVHEEPFDFSLVSPISSPVTPWSDTRQPKRELTNRELLLLMLDDPFASLHASTAKHFAAASRRLLSTDGDDDTDEAQWSVRDGKDPPDEVTSLLLRVAGGYAICTITITIAIVGVVLWASMPSQRHIAESSSVVYAFHLFSVGFFTLDLLMRLVATGWRSSVTSLFVWTDLASVIPFYVHAILKMSDVNYVSSALYFCDLTALRLIRALVVLSRCRLTSEAHMNIRNLKIALQKSSEVLILYFGVLLVTLVIWSTAMYYVERMSLTHWDEDLELLIRRRRTNPSSPIEDAGMLRNASIFLLEYDPDYDEVSPYQSIFHAMWWCIATLTTVGYGDVVPNSTGGRIVAGLTMISGIFVLALPTSILGSNFICLHKKNTDIFQAQQRKHEISPSDTTTNNRVARIFNLLENLVDEDYLKRRQVEYIRRACWHPEYRMRVIWAYSTIEILAEKKKSLSIEKKIRYVGYIPPSTRSLVSPELRRRYGHMRPLQIAASQEGVVDAQRVTLSKVPNPRYASFLYDPAEGRAHSITLLDADMHTEAQQCLVRGEVKVWLKLFRANKRNTCEELRAAYKKQEVATNLLTKLETKTYERFVSLLGLIVDHLEYLA